MMERKYHLLIYLTTTKPTSVIILGLRNVSSSVVLNMRNASETTKRRYRLCTVGQQLVNCYHVELYTNRSTYDQRGRKEHLLEPDSTELGVDGLMAVALATGLKVYFFLKQKNLKEENYLLETTQPLYGKGAVTSF